MTARAYSDLPFTPVDKRKDRPLYVQIASDLRQMIESSSLSAGDVLPPEVDLSKRYGVSRHTVRAALAHLESADLISRNAGRGTFVKPRPAPTTFYLDRSFSRHMRETGRTPRTQLLHQETGTVAADAPHPLVERPHAPCLKLSRLRFGDDEPIALQHAVVLMDRCPDLDTFDWSKRSLYEVLANRYELVVTQIEHAVGVAAAGARQARLLTVAAGEPLLRVITSSYLEGCELIESTTSFYPADRYEYRTVHTLRSHRAERR